MQKNAVVIFCNAKFRLRTTRYDILVDCKCSESHSFPIGNASTFKIIDCFCREKINLVIIVGDDAFKHCLSAIEGLFRLGGVAPVRELLYPQDHSR
jgi:hypothetical protein